jgi:hypothetical protein
MIRSCAMIELFQVIPRFFLAVVVLALFGN